MMIQESTGRGSAVAKIDDGLLEEASDFEGGGFSGFQMGEGQGCADAESNFGGAREPFSFGPSLVRSLEITGNDGIAGPGQHQSRSRFELGHFAAGGTGPFREDDEDVSLILQEHAAGLDTLARIGKPVEGKSIDDDGGDHEPVDVDEEIILSGGGEGVVEFPERKSGEETEDVEVAGVIGNEDIGARSGEVFSSGDFKAVVETEPSPDRSRRDHACAVDKHVGSARKIFQTVDEGFFQVGFSLVAPFFHKTSGWNERELKQGEPSETRASIEVVEIANHVKEEGSDIDQAVDAVEDSSVSGDSGSHVLNSEVAFDHADGEISELSPDADDESGEDQFSRGEMRKGEMEEPGENEGDPQRSQTAFPRFFGADLTAHLMSTEEFSEGEGGDIIQFNGEEDIKEVGIGKSGIGEESEMTEHPTEIDKADDGQSDELELALHDIFEDGDEEYSGDGIDGECHEDAIPAWIPGERVHSQSTDSDGDRGEIDRSSHVPITVESGSAGKFLESENGERREEDDGGDASEKDGQEGEGDHDEPTAVGPPGMVHVLLHPPTKKNQKKSHEEKTAEEECGVEPEDRAGKRSAGRHGATLCDSGCDRDDAIQNQFTMENCKIPELKCLSVPRLNKYLMNLFIERNFITLCRTRVPRQFDTTEQAQPGYEASFARSNCDQHIPPFPFPTGLFHGTADPVDVDPAVCDRRVYRSAGSIFVQVRSSGSDGGVAKLSQLATGIRRGVLCGGDGPVRGGLQTGRGTFGSVSRVRHDIHLGSRDRLAGIRSPHQADSHGRDGTAFDRHVSDGEMR